MSTRRVRSAAQAYSTENCQVARAMAVLGQRGALMVLREVFAGVTRFDDMRHHTGMSRQVLTDRLALLVDHDILRKVPYRNDGDRERLGYELTGKGCELSTVLTAIGAWGSRYYGGPEGPPMLLVHRGCDEVVQATLRCSGGHLVEPREVAVAVGPGARRSQPADRAPHA